MEDRAIEVSAPDTQEAIARGLALLNLSKQEVHIEIVDPDPDGELITEEGQMPFEAIAWNPAYGTTNGDGIYEIHFWFSGPTTIPGRISIPFVSIVISTV